MTFTPADPLSLSVFVIIAACVLAAIVGGTFIANIQLRGPAIRRAAFVALGLAAWLTLSSLAVASGALEARPFPVGMIFFAACNLAGLSLGLSTVGGWLARGISLPALVGFQAFRLPLELVLHHWGEIGTVPVTMTWNGSNFDIVSGILALVIAPFARKNHKAAWVANIVGIVLLLNVMRVAMLSSPLPFAWGIDPPLQLIFHLPYAWIGSVCVAGALAGHVILTRALLLRRRA